MWESQIFAALVHAYYTTVLTNENMSPWQLWYQDCITHFFSRQSTIVSKVKQTLLGQPEIAYHIFRSTSSGPLLTTSQVACLIRKSRCKCEVVRSNPPIEAMLSHDNFNFQVLCSIRNQMQNTSGHVRSSPPLKIRYTVQTVPNLLNHSTGWSLGSNLKSSPLHQNCAV